MSKRSKDYEEANQYTTKHMRDYLSGLSLIAFGSRGKWKKLCNQLGLNIYGIKEQMEAIVKYKQERLEYVKREKVRSRQTENEFDTSTVVDGSGQSNDDGGQ